MVDIEKVVNGSNEMVVVQGLGLYRYMPAKGFNVLANEDHTKFQLFEFGESLTAMNIENLTVVGQEVTQSNAQELLSQIIG